MNESLNTSETGNTGYRGKKFTIPTFTVDGGVRFKPRPAASTVPIPGDSPVIQALNKPFNLQEFKTARSPVSLGVLPVRERRILDGNHGAPRTLDLPIKFPGSDYRIPAELAIYAPIIKRAANFEAAVNARAYDEYYCYLTVDVGVVQPGRLQREAPCHVDGFQGARWNPKVRGNHTITVSNAIPTAYYVQPFNFDLLDEARHDFFFEMNRQVAETNSEFEFVPRDYEMTMMDCYSVHRGRASQHEVFRTFIRISWEVRIFDRLGNAHNPMFNYDWEMVPRDIESLNLQPFDPNCDPSLRVFPHQALDGRPLTSGTPKTQPNLRPRG
jgi:hypothetical protein